MNAEEICKILVDEFGEAGISSRLDGGHPYALVSAGIWHDVALFLRDDRRMGFNMLRCISSLDLIGDEKLAAVYDIIAMAPPDDAVRGLWKNRHAFAVRIEVNRNEPRVPSVADVWPAADWHEREAYDLMGIIFENHPDLTRILCPDDWEGHPLRKDYVFPLEYHGIPGTTEYELPNPIH